MKSSFYRSFIVVFIVLTVSLYAKNACRAASDDMTNFCVQPPFISPTITPNLLFLIDNSASMYDLSYADEGQKSVNGTFTRDPYYCYDETYRSNNTYVGYFKTTSYYQYNFTSEYFEETVTFPANCTYRVANTLCVDVAAQAVTGFVANGN